MSKKNVFDLLENSEEGELYMIDRLTPELSDEQFERILEKSKKKRNKIRALRENQNIRMNRNFCSASDVSGVDVVNRRSAIIRTAAIAASLVILGGGLALGHNLLKDSRNPVPNINPNHAAVTVTTITTEAVTVTTNNTEAVNAAINKTEIISTESTAVIAAGTVNESGIVPDVTISDESGAVSEAVPAIAPVTKAQYTPPETAENEVKTTTAGEEIDNSELVEIVQHLTDNWSQQFAVIHGHINFDSNDYIELVHRYPYENADGTVETHEHTQKYYRTLAPYDTIESVVGFLSQYYLQVDIDYNTKEISDVAEQEGDRVYCVKDDISYTGPYILNNGVLYCSPDMGGFFFDGWIDDSIDVIEMSDERFVAVRRYINLQLGDQPIPMQISVFKNENGDWRIMELY